MSAQPAQAVTATDAGGTDETIQKDVDGVLTTPPWDKNTYDSVYEWVTLPGAAAPSQVLVSNTVKTAEGTVYAYAYAKEGSYPYGTVPWNAPGATPTAANVLKVTSATDRQGNVTTYTYGPTPVSFQKSNGVTSEYPLVGVAMPSGHHLTFTWGTDPNAASYQRVTSAYDDSRTVHYGYGPGGLLTSVTTPGLKTTTYVYGDPWVKAGWTDGVATSLLRTVTDPRGLTTEIRYAMTYVDTGFAYVPGAAAWARRRSRRARRPASRPRRARPSTTRATPPPRGRSRRTPTTRAGGWRASRRTGRAGTVRATARRSPSRTTAPTRPPA